MAGISEIGIWSDPSEVLGIYGKIEEWYKDEPDSKKIFDALDKVHKTTGRMAVDTAMLDIFKQNAYFQTLFGPIKIPEKHMSSWLQAANIGEQSLLGTVVDTPILGDVAMIGYHALASCLGADLKAAPDYYMGARARANDMEQRYRKILATPPPAPAAPPAPVQIIMHGP